MFDTTWGQAAPDVETNAYPPVKSRLRIEDVEAVAILEWAEHCLECAPPDCYHSCLKYKPRLDRKCARLRYGIARNTNFSGLFPYGADCQFEDWGKLECELDTNRLAMVAPQTARHIAARAARWADTALTASKIVKPLFPTLKPVGALTHFRRKWVLNQDSTAAFAGRKPDAFVIECYSYEPIEFRLKVECVLENRLLFSDSVPITAGQNYFEIPFSKFGFEHCSRGQRAGLRIYPENDLNCRLVFTWLDFVSFNPARHTPDVSPATKVKCVAWDLDNTMWKGVLIEDGPDGLELNPDAVAALKALDQRGVINTVVSKNTHEEAWAALEAFGIDEYFVYPAINWGAKSENLKEIARRMNINIDTFAVIDDSAHERAEIGASLPMVRIFSDQQITEMLDHPALDLPITEMSAKRRQTYKDQEQREVFQESFGNDYASYLRSLEIEAEIFSPETDAETDRCFELLQRTNQLNLTSYRYERNEFDALLARQDVLNLGFRVQDRFGAYGIVGFISVLLGSRPVFQDLVISCRIAQKRIEYAIVEDVCRQLRELGYSTLDVTLLRTKKNSLLVSLFEELPFEVIEDTGDKIYYAIRDLGTVKSEDIVTVLRRSNAPDPGAVRLYDEHSKP